MRTELTPNRDYVCEVTPYREPGRWGKWNWRVTFKGEEIASGWQKRLRRAEKAAERAASQHKLDNAARLREARSAQIAAEGKAWSPWL